MKRIMLGATMALFLAVPAAAKDPVFVTSSPVKDKPAITLDTTKAYILLRSDGAIPLHLIKDPSAEDKVAYDGMRAKVLDKARARYAKDLAKYETAKRNAVGLPKGDPRATIPDKPIEPTEANFEITPFELLAGVSVGPMNRFAKGEGGSSVYLQAVTPGSYRIYGPLSVVPGAAAVGSCFCMGSVRFEAKAGEIVDMGMVVTKGASKTEKDGSETVKLVPLVFQLQPASAAMSVDPRLKGIMIRPAVYRPAGKLPNYFGLAIDRMPAIPGVMRYDRDRIVDLAATGTSSQ